MLSKEGNKAVCVGILQNEQSTVFLGWSVDYNLRVISIKKQSVLVTSIQLAGGVKAGRFFLLIYISDNRRKAVLFWKEYVYFFFFAGAETAFGRKGTLEGIGDRELLIRDKRRIQSHHFSCLQISKIGSLSRPVVIRAVINPILVMLGQNVTYINKGNT